MENIHARLIVMFLFFFLFFITVRVSSRYSASVCIEYFIIGATRYFGVLRPVLCRFIVPLCVYCFVMIYCSACNNGLEMGGALAFFPQVRRGNV